MTCLGWRRRQNRARTPGARVRVRARAAVLPVVPALRAAQGPWRRLTLRVHAGALVILAALVPLRSDTTPERPDLANLLYVHDPGAEPDSLWI